MARSLTLLLCLATLTAFSGCTDGGALTDAGPGGGAHAEPDPGTAAEGSRAAGVAGRQGPAPATVVPDAAPTVPAVATCEATVDVGSGVGGNLQSANLVCPFAKADGRVEAYGWALVEAAWPGALPTSTQFYLYVHSDACDFNADLAPCWHHQESSATGSIRLVARDGLLGDFGGDNLRAWTGLDGVAVQQKVALAITLVPEGQDLPDDYSALP